MRDWVADKTIDQVAYQIRFWSCSKTMVEVKKERSDMKFAWAWMTANTNADGTPRVSKASGAKVKPRLRKAPLIGKRNS